MVTRRQGPASNGGSEKWFPQVDPELCGEQLLEQQFWCMGRDVVLPRQNLLLRYGFERFTHHLATATSCYAQRSRTGVTFALWGFGAYLGEPQTGAILLSRHHLCPAVCEIPHWPVHAAHPDALQMRTARTTDVEWVLPLLIRVFRWFAQYEEFVLRAEQAAYLEQTLQGCPRVLVPRAQMGARWHEIADTLKRNTRISQTPAPSATPPSLSSRSES